MTRAHRLRRTTRGAARSFVLTERDLDVLAFIGTGYVGTAQVAREFFPSTDRALRRLRLLFDAKLTTHTLVSSTHPTLVSLTKRGIAAVAARDAGLADSLRLAGPIRAAGVAHHLLTVDARCYAAALGTLRGAPLIEWSGAGGRLGRELGLDDLGLRPDGLARFAAPDGEQPVIAVEVDRGTEALGVIEGKLSRAIPAADDGRLDALWIVVAAGNGRRATLQHVVDRAGLGEWARVLDAAHLTARPVKELPARDGGDVRAVRSEYDSRKELVPAENFGVSTPTAHRRLVGCLDGHATAVGRVRGRR